MKRELITYRAIMVRYWDSLEPDEQRQIQVRLAQIGSVGGTIILMSLTYQFLPVSVRVILFPLFFAVAIYAGTKVEFLLELTQRFKPSFVAICTVLMVAFAFVGIIWGIRQ